MSRVLLATFGSLGDLHPFIALGQRLRERGAEVRLATSAEYRPAVESAGLEFAPMRPSLAQLGDPERVAARVFDPLRGSERLLRELVLPHLRESHADLAIAARDCDLYVSHTLTFGLPLLATSQQRPWLSVALAPMAFLSRHDPPVLPGLDLLRFARRLGPVGYDLANTLVRAVIRRWEQPLRAFRRDLGLPATRALHLLEGQFSPHGTLALFDQELASPQPDWPPRVTLCGAPVYDGRPADPAVLADLRAFLERGDAPVVFALGSSAVHLARDFWRHALDASRRLGRRALLLTGKPVALPAGDDHRAYDYLPYSQVFPHAAAIVHQAGIGTLSQALRAGRPQLLVPVSFDQPDNARRATEAGIARVLPFREAQAANLARELQALLADPARDERARRLAQRLRGRDGAERAADRVVATLEGRPWIAVRSGDPAAA